jgi:hypothetical protein
MFCTVSDVEDFLQIEITEPEQLASVERAIREVSEVIRNYCNQQIDFVVDDEITLDGQGGSKLYLPELPVLSIKSIEEDGDKLTQATDFILGQWGIVHRLGSRWAAGVQNITIIYTHGYQVIPQDIVGVATRSSSRAYQAGLRSAEQGGILGLASYSLGDFSVSFGSEQGGGKSEGVLGVSAARFLLLSEKDVLNKYRQKGL